MSESPRGPDRGGVEALRSHLTTHGTSGNGRGFTLIGVVVEKLDGRDLSDLRCVRVRFEVPGVLERATVHNGEFDQCTFVEGALDRAAMLGSTFRGCAWYGRQAADLTDCTIIDGTFHAVDLAQATLSNARFRGVTIEGNVALPPRNARLDMTIDVPMSQALGPRGADIEVSDDGKTLRDAYTGPWFRIHLAALAVFLAPHVLFLLQAHLTSDSCMLQSDHRCRPLWAAYWDHLVGTGWVGIAHVVTGSVVLLYNVLRVALVIRAITLEERRRFAFSRHSFWRWAFSSYRWLFRVNVVFLIAHLLTFFAAPVRV